jgi:hypothetical protein
MFWGNEAAVNHEQHLDNLRRAEHQRLVAQVEAANPRPGLWHNAKERLAGWVAREQGGGQNQLANKAA